MKINEKLRELRLAQKLTQEEAAAYLDVTSQSVPKWERGILSPDIRLLPRIALLYKISIDAIFDMAFYRGEHHEANFRKQVGSLSAKKDTAGVWDAFMTEIDLCPDRFDYYIDIMLYSLREKLFDDEHISRLLHLADYADGHCHDDDRRNEIHRLMLQICGSADGEGYRARARQYYMQLPLLHHSREVYAKYVLSGEAYTEPFGITPREYLDYLDLALKENPAELLQALHKGFQEDEAKQDECADEETNT